MENLKKDRKSAILKLAQDIANVEGGIYMATFRILIDSVDKALDFNKIVDQCEFNVDLVNGRTYVDAKSLVGIFSLPLYRPLGGHCLCGPGFDAGTGRKACGICHRAGWRQTEYKK